MAPKGPRASSSERFRIKSPAEIIQGRTFDEPSSQAMVRDAVRATTAALIEQLWNPTVVPHARVSETNTLIPMPGRIARVEFPLSEREQGLPYHLIAEEAIAKVLGTVQGGKIGKYEEPFGPAKSLSELAALSFSSPWMGLELSRIEEMPDIDLLGKICSYPLPHEALSYAQPKRVTWRLHRDSTGSSVVEPKLIFDETPLHLVRLPITELTPGFAEENREGTPTLHDICERIKAALLKVA